MSARLAAAGAPPPGTTPGAGVPRAAAGARFLDPKALARIANLSLVARSVVQGFISGLHRSTFLGRSIDFAEHRPYMPGDDIRRLDWRLFARSDRFHIKEFEADTNANFLTVLDLSASMDFGRRGITKMEYARILAAVLAAFSRRQRDRVGLATFDREVEAFVPPSAKGLETVLQSLAAARPRTADPALEARLERPLAEVAAALGRRGLVAVISDFYEPPPAVVRAFDRLLGAGQEVIAFCVLDPAELDLLETDASPDHDDSGARFRDLETGEVLEFAPGRVREAYREAMRSHLEALRWDLGRRGVDLLVVDTATPLDFVLFRYLSERESRRRKR